LTCTSWLGGSCQRKLTSQLLFFSTETPLSHWPPISPSSGFGIHVGQYTGELTRTASRCQAGRQLCGQVGGLDCAAAAGLLSSPEQPEPTSASAAKIPAPVRRSISTL
jgi:hypothetical protein